MHSIKRGSRSFARSIVSEKLLCRWVAPPAGRVAQIFIGTGARLGIREPSAKTPADMGYFAVQMWLTVRYLQLAAEKIKAARNIAKAIIQHDIVNPYCDEIFLKVLKLIDAFIKVGIYESIITSSDLRIMFQKSNWTDCDWLD